MPIAFAAARSGVDAAPSFDGPDLTRYFLVCFALLGAVLLLAWFARRYLVTGMKRRARKRSLHVMDVLPLGGKHKLVVVRCYDRSFLLGVGDKEISSIAELDSEEIEERDEPRDRPSATEPREVDVPQPFHSELAEVLRRPRTPVAESLSEARDAKRAQPWQPGGILG